MKELCDHLTGHLNGNISHRIPFDTRNIVGSIEILVGHISVIAAMCADWYSVNA